MHIEFNKKNFARKQKTLLKRYSPALIYGSLAALVFLGVNSLTYARELPKTGANFPGRAAGAYSFDRSVINITLDNYTAQQLSSHQNPPAVGMTIYNAAAYRDSTGRSGAGPSLKPITGPKTTAQQLQQEITNFLIERCRGLGYKYHEPSYCPKDRARRRSAQTKARPRPARDNSFAEQSY